MKKYYFLLYIFFFLTISCKKNKEISNVSTFDTTKVVKLPRLVYTKYMENVPKTDTLCSGEIERAKNDLSKYDGVYVQTICFGCDFKPYEEEIKEVLKRKKFKLGIQDLGCVIYQGQTQGCYSAYIDLKMKAKYGENYKSEIENDAIKILIKNININNKVISIYDLEPNEKPKILNPKIAIENDYYTTIKTNLPINKKSMNDLFTDIEFIVEKDGTISNLKETNWVNEKGINKKYKQELVNLAINTLKKDYNNWKPGTYKGVKARIENTLRISFE
ncbi:hypothetical protein SAMN06265349_10680 [Flavobacterium resistens]|uniref:Uncharacterized protein n=1 Tax=Flavobacterium resistens TaxID=443612 RepID=A0A521F0U5_9FLAO|nr:hypothetical protein [Flavobacterium resistens]MRX69384.1 hypothetical protein [Flavobacterium resistens]SMO89789.1 hypothetical protein SAMN06265349_10680 [Flavobacterium resistens]